MIPTDKRDKPYVFPYEIGTQVIIYKGKHAGKTGTVIDFKKPKVLPLGVCYIDMIPVIKLDDKEIIVTAYSRKIERTETHMELFNGKSIEQVEQETNENRDQKTKEGFERMNARTERRNEKVHSAVYGAMNAWNARTEQELHDKELELQKKHDNEIKKLRNEDDLSNAFRGLASALTKK